MDKQVASHESFPSPHVLMYPLPFPSHIHSMLNLAQILCLSHLKVTMLMTLRTRSNNNDFLRFSDLESHFSGYPGGGIRFEYIPDGLPDDHPGGVGEVVVSLAATGKPLLKEMLVNLKESAAAPRCIIADGMFTFASEVAEEVGVPIFYFYAVSAGTNWTCLSLPKLIRAGELPLKGQLRYLLLQFFLCLSSLHCAA